MGNFDPSQSPQGTRPSLAAWRIGIIGISLVLLFVALKLLRSRGQNSSLPAPPAKVAEPRVVSLLPQATDILMSIGCGDHLVGVSNYDLAPEVANLPRVGDYELIDWEKIAALHPKWIITHYGNGRASPGFTEHADAIGAHQLNLLTETLGGPDESLTIHHAITELGRICKEPQKAATAEAALRQRLARIQQRVNGLPPVPALIVIGPEGTLVAGKETFLSELLQIAGGANVAARLASRYPTLDREQLLQLNPQVILQLLPGESQRVCEQARTYWDRIPNVPAVKNKRIIQLTQTFVTLPGYHVADVAEAFAGALHPAPNVP